MSDTPRCVWLLEIRMGGQHALYYKTYGRPIDGGRDDLHITNPDPTQAKQFSSKKEADDYAEFYGLHDQLVAYEHMFDCGTSAAPTAEEK